MINMSSRVLYILLVVSTLFACKKDYFRWDLEKKKTMPVVTTIAVNAVYATAASVQLKLESNGNSEISSFGVCVGLENDPDINSNTNLTQASDSIQTILIGNLTPSTTYYVRAFAQNEVGVAYGASVSFTTTSTSAPAISTTQASSVSSSSAQIGGIILSDGGLSITSKGLCYSSTSTTPTLSGLSISAGSGNSPFTSTLTGLQNSTVYFARAYATNSMGTSYGQTISFTTVSAPDALVGNNSCNSLSGLTAMYISWGGSNYQASPMCIANNGYSGSCINDCASNALGAYVEFSRNFSSSGHIRFRSRAYDGNSIRVPLVYLDGSSITATDLNPNASANEWHQIKSSNIPSGQHVIRIEWSQISTFYDYSIDEIEFWE
jgi:hypothetical protein